MMSLTILVSKWIKWRLTFGVLCNKKLSPRLKEKFYRRVVRLDMLNGEVLISQELANSKNESDTGKNIAMNVWTY